MIDEFRKHNAPLDAQLKKEGYKKVHKNGLTFFVDTNNEYVPYPPGYITGPSTRTTGDPKCHFYVSVRLSNGCWTQRNFLNGHAEEATAWALQEAAKHIQQPVFT